MRRAIDLVLIATILGAAAWTYRIKHDAQDIQDQLAKIEHKISLEKETMSLLEADWSLLSQPDRLETLMTAYQDDLKLQPIRPDQIVNPDELPAPKIVVQPDPQTAGSLADNSKTMVR